MQKEKTSAKSTARGSKETSKNGPGQSHTKSSGGRTADTSHKPNRSSEKSGRKEQVEDSRLKEFFTDELKDIYWAEQKLVKTLPKLQKAASSEELQEAFSSHLEETKGHVERLEQAFKLLGEKAQAKKCDAMEGITEEGASVIEDTDDGTATRDVALIMAGQKAEHYEIATYGGLIQIAQTLGLAEVANLLEQTLEEEKAADQKLTEIAESNINYSAAGEKK
ncbi:MAG TPA: ferritin-like domain-containing protein [Puia sp.]|nr:ferritin-like domain-containing protein [Puia sp.]